MATIFLRYVGGTQRLFKATPASVTLSEGATVSDLLDQIWGGRPIADCDVPFLILLNGSSIHYYNKHQTVLKDGDTLSFLPFLAGG